MSKEPRENAGTQSKKVGFYNVMSAYSATTNYPSQVESYKSTNPQRQNSAHSDEQTSPRNVSFGNPSKREEEKDKRQKYLTARYGQHQMMLIRKRLAVEDWLYEKLRDMYNCENEAEDHECQLDLEDILNFDTDSERLQYAHENLTDAKKPPDIVNGFIQELLQKAKTL
ncbi:protein phosphatase 1 regulatory subunit 14C-like [Ruditapes philippinarum]|uniref:protein phosphatase 1 regulatory subunit 14C-like n=1 Tax=Ruditapes philippinarum TaxID=129788 RepID=UPI00295BBE19|nr:protein phosphatase 1 regulatory subunit 14C-like [Ruditapes philippinarum]